jgi:Flp pilus assembly pilin Flp
MLARLRAILADDSGVALVEYGIVLTAFGALILGLLAAIQLNVGTALTNTATGLLSFSITPP